jgi:hypothetical protein
MEEESGESEEPAPVTGATGGATCAGGAGQRCSTAMPHLE